MEKLFSTKTCERCHRRRRLNSWFIVSIYLLIFIYFTNCSWGAVVVPTQKYGQHITEEHHHLTLKSLSSQGIHWGEYEQWSDCSQTCGTGLESRRRFCLNNLNETVDNLLCNGTSREYRVCRIKNCRDPNDANYRYDKCSQFELDGLRWKPHIGNSDFPADPCSVMCFAVNNRSRIELLSDIVPDGTQCFGSAGTTQYQGVCFDRQCLVVGCDRLLNSTKTYDQCGVCGGDGSTCQTISGTFVRENLQVGYTYTEVLEIPPGARNIHIYEMERSKNYLAVSDSEGTFYLNGDLNINQPGRYRIAGAVFRYQRSNVLQMRQWREEPEVLTAQGPIDRVIIIMVLKLESTAHIVFEYTVPVQTTHDAMQMMSANRPTYIGEEYENERTEVDDGIENIDTIGDENVTIATEENGDVDLSDVEEFRTNSTVNNNSSLDTNFNDRNYSKIDSTHDFSQNKQKEDTKQFLLLSEVESLKQSSQPEDESKFKTNIEKHRDHLHGDISAKHLSIKGTVQPSPMTSIKIENSSLTTVTPDEETLHFYTEDVTEELSQTDEFSSYDEESSYFHSTDELTGTITHEEPPPGNGYTLQDSDENQNAEEPLIDAEPNIWDNNVETTDGPLYSSDSIDIPEVIDVVDPIGPHTYRWQKTGVAPCSTTCTRGTVSEFAYCENEHGVQVPKHYCNQATKPSVLAYQCAGQPCDPRWEVGNWSECSRTCGQGVNFRTIHCWRMIAPGLDSSINNDLCNSTEAPPATKPCKDLESCGPQWQTSDWSECSKTCGDGNITREVTCSSSYCDPSKKPPSFKPCNQSPCPSWSPGSWSKCSGPCHIQERDVQCRSRYGAPLPDSACPASPQPFSAQLCGMNCPAKWVPQKYSSCNGSCDNAFRQHKVLCLSRRGSLILDKTCPHWNRPPSREVCTMSHCQVNSPLSVRQNVKPRPRLAKWLTTSWSQCSRTCGSGLRTRSVKCYLNGELSNSCNLSERPDSSMQCANPDCPVQISTCRDSPTANCRLILSANLCQYQTYRRTCCLTCQEPGRR
ncbi:ADAMTS-like protein 2 [Amphiura filiformis]|uniref:ADAMTS-like protein 2 n=1 Tax=Amphiura filiformis TaxID=82378 RepID=UPI003B20C804